MFLPFYLIGFDTMSVDFTLSAWQLILCFVGAVTWVSKMQFDVIQIKKRSSQAETDIKEIMKLLTEIRILLEHKQNRRD